MNLTSMNDSSNYSYSDLVPHTERTVVAFLYIVVGIFGTFGNLLVILAISLSYKLQTPTNVFVLSLGIADLLVSTMQPLQVVGLLAKDGWPLPEKVCEFAGSVIVVSVTSSVLTLAMIAVNRHCLITKSRRFYMWVYQARNMFVMVFFSWVLPIGVLILPQAVGFGKLGYDEFTHLCAWDFSHHLAKFYQSIAAAIGVAAYSIVLICYSLIYLHLRNHSKALHQHFKHLPQNRIDKKVQVNVKITMNLFYVVCVYMVCVVPYSLCLLAISQSNATARHASLYLALILVVNSCANVVIYGLKHPHFRAVFKCIITCHFAEIPQPSRILQLLLQKSTDNSTSAIPSDKPVNLTSDAWPSHNFGSMKKNTSF